MTTATFVISTIIAATVLISFIAPRIRWFQRHLFSDHLAESEAFVELRSAVESINMSVNKVPPGDRRLIERVDDIQQSVDRLHGEVHEFRGEVRELRAEVHDLRADAVTVDQVVAVADALDEAHGDDPPLSREQAREIARRRAAQRGEDNPEHHHKEP